MRQNPFKMQYCDLYFLSAKLGNPLQFQACKQKSYMQMQLGFIVLLVFFYRSQVQTEYYAVVGTLLEAGENWPLGCCQMARKRKLMS